MALQHKLQIARHLELSSNCYIKKGRKTQFFIAELRQNSDCYGLILVLRDWNFLMNFDNLISLAVFGYLVALWLICRFFQFVKDSENDEDSS